MSRTSREGAVPLLYVYTGNALPSHAKHNLLLTKKRFSGPIILLTDREIKINGIECVNISSWYDPSPFQRFCDASPLDSHFRGGFWLRATERFFIQDQFMRKRGLSRAFQVEMDVMVLDLEGYAEFLDGCGKGIFAPMEAPAQAVASLLYVNSPEALSELCAFTVENAHLGNEQKILGNFIDSRPHEGHGLPSNHALDSHNWPLAPSTVPTHQGIIDATFLGMWVFGQDPRNSEKAMWNHLKHGLVKHPTEHLRIRGGISARNATIRLGDSGPFPLRTIHVHSKVFLRLRWPGVLAWHFFVSNLPWRSVIVPKWNNLLWVAISPLLETKKVVRIQKAPRAVRQAVAGVIGFSLAQSSRLPSNRQHKAFARLLSPPNISGHAAKVDVVIACRETPQEKLILQRISEVSRSQNQIQSITVVVPEHVSSTLNLGERVRVLSVPELLEDSGHMSSSGSQNPRLSGHAQFEIALGLVLRDSKQLGVLAVDQSQPLPWTGPLLNTRGNQIVFLSEDKRAAEKNLTSDFLQADRREVKWGISDRLQVFQVRVVREIWATEGALFDWATLESADHERLCSISQTYGTVVLDLHPIPKLGFYGTSPLGPVSTNNPVKELE